MNKKNKWLMAMKELAEEKSASTELAQENEPAISPTKNRHPIIWMVFGMVSTLFMTGYWNTIQENKMLKAMVVQNIEPSARLTRTGFDFTQPTNEIDWDGYKVELPTLDLPPTYDNPVRQQRNLTPADPDWYCQWTSCGRSSLTKI